MKLDALAVCFVSPHLCPEFFDDSCVCRCGSLPWMRFCWGGGGSRDDKQAEFAFLLLSAGVCFSPVGGRTLRGFTSGVFLLFFSLARKTERERKREIGQARATGRSSARGARQKACRLVSVEHANSREGGWVKVEKERAFFCVPVTMAEID